MRTSWLVFVFLCVCVAGLVLARTPAQADTHPAVGRWIFEQPGDRRVLVLKADGHFELDVRRTSGAARTAGTWRAGEGRLELTSDDAAAGKSVTSFAVADGTLSIENHPADGQPMRYRRDQGPLVGRWGDEAGSVTVEFRADGRCVRERQQDGRAEGSYDVAYEEPTTTRGSLTVRLAKEAAVSAVFSLAGDGEQLSLSDPDAGTPALVLRRLAESQRPGSPFVGRWRALAANGAVELDIEQQGSAFRVTSGGQTSEARARTANEIEGAEVHADGELRFLLTLRGERLHARFTAVASDGSSKALPELVFVRVTAGAADALTPGFAGRWESRTAQGTTVLVVSARGDGSFLLLADGQSIVARTSAEGKLEGAQTVGEVTAAVSLTLDGDRLLARFTFRRADGTSQELGPLGFVRSAEPKPGSETRDQALVGHWRFTSAQNMVMDFNLELGAAGHYRWWIVPSEDEPETGVWRTEGGRIFLRAVSAGAEQFFGTYALGAGAAVMLITRPDGQKRPYQRQ